MAALTKGLLRAVKQVLNSRIAEDHPHGIAQEVGLVLLLGFLLLELLDEGVVASTEWGVAYPRTGTLVGGAGLKGAAR